MGQSLNQLVCQRRTVPEVTFLQNRSLSKLQQYYKICKQISETFSIDSTQFIQIFGEYHGIFDLLDTNHNLLIDELQLFTSMALFSTLIQVEDKVDFIFKLFDFNGLKSLSVTDLQFMFITCVGVVMKLLGIKSALCENDIIGFVNSQFQHCSRVNISQIKNWAVYSEDVAKFMHIINGDQTVYQACNQNSGRTLLGQKIYSSFQQCSRNELGCLLPTNCRKHAYTKILQKQQKKWLQQHHKLIEYQPNNPLTSTMLNNQKSQNTTNLKQQLFKMNDKSDITLKLNWVYGIRHRDVKYFINFNMENQLVYFVGKVVIVYNVKADIQKYYQQHQQPVICIAVDRSPQRQSKQHGLVATSELVAHDDISQILPSIHIWNPNTLKTIAIIKGHHKIGIHLMKFTNSGQFLVTCGLVYDSPVIVYGMGMGMGDNYQVVYSIACSYPTVEISTLYGIIDKKCDDFVVATLYGIKYFQISGRHCREREKYIPEFTCTSLKNKQQNSQHQSQTQSKINSTNNKFSPITCCTFIYINQNMKYLSAYDNNKQKIVVSGHERGQVYVWSVSEPSILYELCVEPCEITCVIPSCSYLMVCSNSSIINCWDIDLSRRVKLFHVDITTLELELNCYEVAGMVERPSIYSHGLCLDSRQAEYVVGTTKGDFFMLSLQKKDHNSLKFKIIGPRYESKELSKIISIDEISVQKLLERQNQQNLILFGGKEGTLNFLNTSSHRIIQRWKIGEPIIALDFLQTKQKLEIVVGTANNQIYSSTNFVQKNERYEMDKPIKCLKLIMDSNHVVLIVGLEGGHLHFINRDEGMENKKILNRMSTQSQNVSRKVITKADQNYQNKVLSSLPNGHTATSQDITYPKQNTNFIKKIKLASSPTNIISLEKKMLIISTEDNIFYILSLKDYHFSVIEPNKNPLSPNFIKNKCINLYYCLNKIGKGHKGSKRLYRLPVIIGKHQRMVMTANVDSSMSVWKNLTENSSQNRLNYNWHSSRCAGFAINDQMTKLYSCGLKDGMLIETNILRFYQDHRSIREPSRALVSASSSLSLANYHSSLLESDPQFQKELQFCTFSNEITTEAYDQHIQIRGLENQTLTRLFKGMSQQWKQSNKKLLPFNTVPKISLKLDYVYGIETDNKRSTVLALNLPYVQFVYFVACVVVVYDPAVNGQKIYRGHRYKVTCIDKILMSSRGCQSYQLIVSAESAYKPTIKIWHPLTLQTINTISTVHTHGIMHIHSTPSTILSYGISQKNPQTFSLQMSQTQTGQKLAHRQLRSLIHWLAINPINQNQFCTTGKYNVTIWRIISGNIERYSVVQINGIGTYCIYRLIQCRDDEGYMQEIIIGCENGQLGLISGCSKYICIDEKAHQKAINCIAFIGDSLHRESYEGWSQLKNKNIRHIVTCSQDQTLKIWNKNFQLEFEQQARKIQFEDRSQTTNITTATNGNINQNLNGLMGLTDKRSLNVNTNSVSKQKMLFKNIAIQSISPIHDRNHEGNICLLLATRNGDIFMMRQFNSLNIQQIRKKPTSKNKEKRVSLVDKKIQMDESVQQFKGEWRKGKNSRRSSGFKKSVTKIAKPKQQSSFMLKQRQKSKLVLNATQKRLSYLSRKIISSQHNSYEQGDQQQNNQSSYKRIESAQYILYLRGHSSQICTSARPEYNNNKQKGNKILFAHHPRLEVMVTMSQDQNLMFWDTERNVLILNRMLGYLADPTVLKFTKDGDILIVGYSDGRLLFLDSQISKSHQGKGDDKFVLPTLRIVMQDKNLCPVLAIQQSESGDHLAVSYNNKPPKTTQPKPQATQSSHICIFLNKSRDKIRTHGSNKIQHNIPYQNITTIPCQADSIYKTQNNNKYGIAVHEMMFTENEGKTYLLIYEQLVDINTHNKLNYSKDGNYIIWDVNTSTMIANTDQVCSLMWRKIAVSNSIYARYQRYGYLTLNHEYNSQNSNSNGSMYVNSNLLIPYISAMVNLPNYIILGSVNGDIHIAYISCLEYDKILESNPKNRDLFVGKTYNAHCSQVTHIEYNQDRTVLYTSAIGDRCVYKWRIQGDFVHDSPYLPANQQHHDIITNVTGTTLLKNMPLAQLSHLINSTQNIPKDQQKTQVKQQVDLFKEVPTFQQIQQMKKLYTFKQKVLWNLAVMQNIGNDANQNQHNEVNIYERRQLSGRNVSNFASIIKVVGIIGRRACNVRDNLLYDYNARVVYSVGHTFVVLPTNPTNTLNLTSSSKKQDNKCSLQKSQRKIDHPARQLIHMMSGSGQDPTQQISCLCISKDRKLVYTGHNGLNASVSAWDISTKLRLKTIILKKIMIILIIRCSPDNKTLIVYGINAGKIGYLMLICLTSCEVLGIANFTHQKICSIKDIAYYPKSNSKFVTCGINETLSWKLQGNQLTYTMLQLPLVAAESISNSAQNYVHGANMNSKECINICITFLPKSMRILTGCQDGNLIFWGENTFQRKEHTDMVMVLKSCQPNILLSGSRDGTVLLWMEQSNGSGLTLSSKLNLRNQSATIFKPHGTSLLIKSSIPLIKPTESEAEQSLESKQKKRKLQLKPSGKSNQSMTKYQNSKNTMQEIIMQELSVQSIDLFSLTQKQDETTIQNISKNGTKPKLAVEQDQNMGSIRNDMQKQVYCQQTFIPKKWKVLMGTISGNIYETTIIQQNRYKINFEQNCQLLQIYHDHQIPKSFFFSKNDKQIYEITSRGYFCCRRIADSAVIFEQNFNKETVDMIYSAKNGIFFIVFKTQIRSFQLLDNINPIEAAQTLLKPLATLQLKFITHAQISTHEKVLAVGVTKNSDKSINVQIYDISKKQQIKSLVKFAMPAGQTIQFIDFSLNNKIVIAKLESGKMISQQLLNVQSIKQDQIPFIQWGNRAQNLYDCNRKIVEKVQAMFENAHISEQSCPEQLRILRINEIADNVYVLIDNQGHVYAVNNQIELIGYSKLKLSEASIIKFSHSKRLLGIGSEIDRSIVIFDIGLMQRRQ